MSCAETDSRASDANERSSLAPVAGSLVMLWIGNRPTHRRVVRRHGQLMIRDRRGWDRLADYAPEYIGAGTYLWKWRGK